MRGLFALNRHSGLADAASDLMAQANAAQTALDGLNSQLTAVNNQIIDVQSQINQISLHPDWHADSTVSAVYNKLADLQKQASNLQLQISTTQSTISTKTNAANAAATAPTVTTPAAPSAAATAQAARDYVATQELYSQIAVGGRPDFGRGTVKRNEFYKGLGGLPMRGLFGLDARPLTPKRVTSENSYARPVKRDRRRGLSGFDLMAAVEQGAAKGFQQYIASPDKGKLPGLNIPNLTTNLPSVSLPSWLTKPFTSVASGVASSVNAARNAPAPSAAATGVRRPITAPSTGFSPLALAGLAALVIGGGIYVARKA